jgi:hypothetical protein
VVCVALEFSIHRFTSCDLDFKLRIYLKIEIESAPDGLTDTLDLAPFFESSSLVKFWWEERSEFKEHCARAWEL